MITTTLCYLKRGGKTLMLHRIKKDRDFHQGKWNGLGGKMNPGETPEECVIREVFEESGLTITRPRLRGILTFPVFDGAHDWLAFVFTATDFTGELMPDPPEGHLQWIDDAKVVELPLWEGDQHFLKWIAEGHFFSAKFIYKDKKYISHDVVFYGTHYIYDQSNEGPPFHLRCGEDSGG